eukprot:jgi/Psemu1/302139/fgenesh1_kg.59_\
MFRYARPMICVVIFLAMVIYNSLLGADAFVAISGVRHFETTGSQQSQRALYPINKPSLLSSHQNNRDAESAVGNGSLGLDRQHDESMNRVASLNHPDEQQTELLSSDRRRIFFRMGSMAFMGMLASTSFPSSALALKQKNEALCGTGFFEHIYEYKCTAIGDIQDEGVSKAMNQEETGVTDSLIGKLGFDTADVIESIDSDTKKVANRKPTKGSTIAVKYN